MASFTLQCCVCVPDASNGTGRSAAGERAWLSWFAGIVVANVVVPSNEHVVCSSCRMLVLPGVVLVYLMRPGGTGHGFAGRRAERATFCSIVSRGDGLPVPLSASDGFVILLTCSPRWLALVVAVVLMRASGTYPRHHWTSRLVGVVVR